jgi:TonB family protein
MQWNETDAQPEAAPAAASLEEKQRRRMIVALALLLLALLVVLIKDRQFWLASTPAQEPAREETTTSPVATQTAAPTVSSPHATSTTVPRSRKASGRKAAANMASRAVAQAQVAEPEMSQPQAGAGPVITATNRTVLPPLEVEVVAGNSRRPLRPKNNSVDVDMGPSPFAGLGAAAPAPDKAEPAAPAPDKAEPAPTSDQPEAPPVSDNSAQVTLPQATAERVSRSVKPGYPVLAKQMKVQGAVVLQALIDKAGGIQELHVVSGPGILASAAQEAVKQWRFKPYYEQGQPVETEARITVNFTISTY